MERIKISRAIVVEGRDDVDAVGKACDALIIPTHGFGITGETWALIAKAYESRGLIILTDPDFSGEEIRRKLTARFPDSIQAYIAQEDAYLAGDIGVENASPEVIIASLRKALDLADATEQGELNPDNMITMQDIEELGLVGTDGAAELRNTVCANLGIGHANAKTLIKKLNYWNIGREKLEQTVKEIEIQ